MPIVVNAPVSSLMLFGRKQSFAYQKEVEGNPAQRHHIRFWYCPPGWSLPGGGHVDWLAAATYDRAVGLSALTLQVTHKIDADIDIERNYVVDDVRWANEAAELEIWPDVFTSYHDKNGGGDRVVTDGALHVLVKGAPDRILERCAFQTGPAGEPGADPPDEVPPLGARQPESLALGPAEEDGGLAQCASDAGRVHPVDEGEIPRVERPTASEHLHDRPEVRCAPSRHEGDGASFRPGTEPLGVDPHRDMVDGEPVGDHLIQERLERRRDGHGSDRARPPRVGPDHGSVELGVEEDEVRALDEHHDGKTPDEEAPPAAADLGHDEQVPGREHPTVGAVHRRLELQALRQGPAAAVPHHGIHTRRIQDLCHVVDHPETPARVRQVRSHEVDHA